MQQVSHLEGESGATECCVKHLQTLTHMVAWHVAAILMSAPFAAKAFPGTDHCPGSDRLTGGTLAEWSCLCLHPARCPAPYSEAATPSLSPAGPECDCRQRGSCEQTNGHVPGRRGYRGGALACTQVVPGEMVRGTALAPNSDIFHPLPPPPPPIYGSLPTLLKATCEGVTTELH